MHELAVALEHIDARHQENLWICVLFSAQEAVLISLVREKVAEAKRSEADIAVVEVLGRDLDKLCDSED